MAWVQIGSYGGRNRSSLRANTETDFTVGPSRAYTTWTHLFSGIRIPEGRTASERVPPPDPRAFYEAAAIRGIDRSTIDPHLATLALHKVSYVEHTPQDDEDTTYSIDYLETWSDTTFVARPSRKIHFAVQTGFEELRGNADRPGQYDNFWDGYLFEVPLAGPGGWRFTCNREITNDYVVELAFEVLDY